MHRRYKAFAAGLACLLLSSQLAAEWQITRFVAYQGPAIDAPDRREAWEASLDPSRDISISDQAINAVSPGWREQEDGAETPDPDFEELIPEMEAFLNRVAVEYSSMGFADPVANGWLDSVVRDESGQLAIRFYLYKSNNPDVPQAWATTGTECKDYTSRKAFMINTAKFAPAKEGKRVVRGVDWATLAHELMHPVILSSAFMNGHCSVGRWISEGIPDAISIDITRAMRNTDFGASIGSPSGASKVFGLRRYSHPLQVHALGDDEIEADRSDDEEWSIKERIEGQQTSIVYASSSFWRYLAETRYIKKRNPNDPYPTSRTNRGPGYSYVDYAWVVDLFNSRHPYMPADPMKADPLADLRWVNEFLKSDPLIKSSVQRMHSRFISSMANYHTDRLGPAREAAVKGLDTADMTPSMETWMRVMFNGCESAANPIGGNDGADVDVRILPNAAACIRAEPEAGPYPYGTSMDILVLGNKLNLLKQLRIGLPDGSFILAPEIYSFMGDGAPYYARWSFPLSAVRDGTLIVTNMASKPRETRLFTGNFRFSLGTWESDMTTVPLPPSEPPAAKDKDGWRPTRREQVKKDNEAALAAPLDHLVATPSVKRKAYDKPAACDPQKLELNLCGPQLHISLDLNPFGSANSIRGASAAGLYSDLMGVDALNPMAAMQKHTAAFLRLEQELEARDGDSIDIYIPKIEYGFTGSFNNAVIKVDKAKPRKRDNEKDYTAYGAPVPRDDGPGKIWRPPTGKVTIDEYSQYLLSGSFSAGLIDDDAGSSDNPVIARTVSGRFRIPSPFTGDENFELVPAQFEDEMIQSSLEMMPTGHLPMQEVIKQIGTPPAIMCEKLDRFQLRAIGMEEACQGVTRDTGIPDEVALACSCECDERETEKALQECEPTCRRKWRDCPIDLSRIPTGLEDQIEYCTRKMLEKGIPEMQIPLFMEKLREVPESMRLETMGALCG